MKLVLSNKKIYKLIIKRKQENENLLSYNLASDDIIILIFETSSF